MNINFLVIFCFVSAFKTIASENNGNRNIIEEFINRLITNKEAENHGSICKFKAEDLLATIKDIVNKQITEFCTATNTSSGISSVESSIITQLSDIKNKLDSLEERVAVYKTALLKGQKQLSDAVTQSCSHNSISGYMKGYFPNTEMNKNKNQKSAPDYSQSTPTMTSGSTDDSVGARDAEILKFNSSIHVETSLTGPSKKVFTYYWKITDMTFKLSYWDSLKSLRSPSFYVFPSGYRMYMRAFPRQNKDNFFVRVGLTEGEFDDSLKWPFPLKYKVHILDQTKECIVFEDIASMLWDPNSLCSDVNWQKPIKGDNAECTEVGFPHDVLKRGEYIYRNTLVIKLTVYLEL